MNKMNQTRYAAGKAVRKIESETGECQEVRIGKGLDTMRGDPGLRISFTAPDGRETVLIVSDAGTLARIAEQATGAIKAQADFAARS